VSESVEQAALIEGIGESLRRIEAADVATRSLFEEIRLLHEEWLEQLTARVDSLTTIVAGRE
jgi:hypothetical protein